MKNLFKVIVLAMFISCCIPTIKVSAATTSENFSNFGAKYSDICWEYEETTETLTISGTGAMPDFTYNNNLTQIIGYKSVKHLVISEGITSIGNYAMYKNTGLEDVSIASTVKSIGLSAFEECYNYSSLGGSVYVTGLTSLTGMQGVEIIGERAFYGNSKLADIPPMPNLKTVEDSAFYNAKITTLDAPVLTTVGAYSFKYIDTLTTVNTPLLTNIGKYAFENDSTLVNVNIATNPTVAIGAFINTPVHASYHGKSSVGIGKNNTNDVIAEFDDYTRIIRVYGAGEMRDFINSINLLSSLNTTGTILGLRVEEGVTNIGAYFLYKSLIPEVHIAKSVKVIGPFAIAEMAATTPKGLLKVTGMQGLESIGVGAFYNSYNITTVDSLPVTLTTIGDNAFQYTYGLNSLINNAKTPQIIGSSAFSGMGGSVPITERVVYCYSTNTTFDAAIKGQASNHQIVYFDSIPDPLDYTLEKWVENGNSVDSWFINDRTIDTYISAGGTAVSWENLYGWYPNSFISFGGGAGSWIGYGGSSSSWTGTGGSASSFISAGGSGSLWTQGGGSQQSFLDAGGTLAEFSITTPDKVSDTAAQIILTADQTLFGYSFPTDIPIHQLNDFTVVTPSDLQIINLSAAGQIKITSISVEGLEGWKLEDFNADFKQMTIDTEKFSISLNGQRVDKNTSSIPVKDELAMLIRPGAALDLDVDFKMSGQSKQLVNTPAQLLFTLDWYK